MRVASEFSRFANQYNSYNIIQQQVARKLVSMLPAKEYSHILDLGCGRGEVYNNLVDQDIIFESFHGIDISAGMLELHPKDPRVSLTEASFDTPHLPESSARYDLVLSASALQWSSDLDLPLTAISSIGSPALLAIFTSGTFRTLHATAGIISPIYTDEYLRRKIEERFGANFDIGFETVEYKLVFDSTLGMLRYIKKSGTSGGERYMRYRETKRLLDVYPLDYLEFEVLFVKAIPKYLKSL